MRKRLFTCLILSLALGCLLFPCTVAYPQTELQGSWKGELDLGFQKLPLVFHFSLEDSGWSGKMDSPNQGARDIPLSKVLYDGLLLHLEIDVLQASFEGIFQQDSFQGQFKQAGLSLPLQLQKAEMTHGESSVINRPQEPKGPFPYEAIEATFINGPEGYALKGTITKPEGQGQFPAVVLVSGSGPQDRNSEIFGHKPFWVIADYLTRQGIVVFRYDERGVGNSEGDFKGATSLDFARDARAALEKLHSYEFVDKNRLGVLGHSEGGLIAWILGAEGREIPNFLVALAPPVVAIDELMVQQTEDAVRATGAPESLVESQKNINRKLYSLIRNSNSPDEARISLESYLTEEGKVQGLSGEALETNTRQQLERLQQMLDPWFYSFIKTNPAEWIAQIDLPVWAGFGEKDVQVNASANQKALEAILSGNKSTFIKTYTGLNHLFQPANTGAVAEYGEIEVTFSEEVLGDIAQWILGLE